MYTLHAFRFQKLHHLLFADFLFHRFEQPILLKRFEHSKVAQGILHVLFARVDKEAVPCAELASCRRFLVRVDLAERIASVVEIILSIAFFVFYMDNSAF